MMKKKGEILSSKTAVIILAILVFVLVVFFIFRADINNYLRSLPGFSYEEGGKDDEYVGEDEIVNIPESNIVYSSDAVENKILQYIFRDDSFFYLDNKKTNIFLDKEDKLFIDKIGFLDNLNFFKDNFEVGYLTTESNIQLNDNYITFKFNSRNSKVYVEEIKVLEDISGAKLKGGKITLLLKPQSDYTSDYLKKNNLPDMNQIFENIGLAIKACNDYGDDSWYIKVEYQTSEGTIKETCDVLINGI